MEWKKQLEMGGLQYTTWVGPYSDLLYTDIILYKKESHVSGNPVAQIVGSR